jgi:hypothetical protein
MQQSFKVKSQHGWFNNGLTLYLTYDNSGEKVIRIIGKRKDVSWWPGKDKEETQELDPNGVAFDPTNPKDIQTLFMFTGTDPSALYCLEDGEEIQNEEERLQQKWTWPLDKQPTKEEKEEATKEFAAFAAKYEQKRRDIRKWIYSFPLKPGIKMVSERTCGCNMGHCGATLGIELDPNLYNTLGELFEMFSGGSSAPCYARFSSCSLSRQGGECTCDSKESDDNPWYEHPDSVYLYIEKVDQDKVYKVYPKGCYSRKTTDVNLKLSDEDTQYTIMSWSYGR